MSRFNIGDEVMLLPSSTFYYQAPEQKGVVIAIIKNSWFNVKFENGYVNSYTSKDVLVLNKKPKKIKEPKLVW